ncbi:MAG: molybdopterin-dependent oxidoreductase [Dehalococcoidia bacterium]
MAITITLDGVEVSGNPGMTILDLARESGVYIPTLCHDPHLNPYGACRICLVENEQNGALLASCVAPIAPGMVINTRSEKVMESRRTIIKMMLASHPDNCMVCDKGNRCQLRQIAAELGVGWVDFHRIPHPAEIQDLNPFIERDLSKCILCAKCIRADHELVVEGAIDYFNRGFPSKPATLGDTPLELSNCTFCGTCVALCPTGALQEKIKPHRGSTDKAVSTVCGFCGCGCNIDLEISGGQLVRARPTEGDTPNGATLCVRGSYGFDYIHSPHRLTQPQMKVDGEFQPVSWDEALSKIAGRLGDIKSAEGGQSLGVLGSSKCTNEENYLLQKFAREVLKTPNIDNGGSLYNQTTRKGFAGLLEFPASTSPMSDIEQAEVIVLVGDDPPAAAPQVGYAIKRAVKYKNASLIIINSHDTALDSFAQFSWRPQKGTEETLIGTIMKTIVDQGIWHKSFVGERTSGFDEFSKSLESLTSEHVEKVTGVPYQEVQDVARLLAQSKNAVIIYGSEITRRASGDRIVAALADLALLTGNMGKPGAGILAIQEENNGLGAADMGCLPDFLPGYQPVTGDSGLSILGMVEQAKSGKVKGMYIMGENPVVSIPDSEEALSSLDFLVVQDLFLTETAKLADVVLPAAGFAEKDGTFTNFERRVQRVCQAVEPPGESLPDWQIIGKVAEAMGSPLNYDSPREIMAEIASGVPLYKGISYDDMPPGGIFWGKANGGRQGTVRLYEEGFSGGFGRFAVSEVETTEEGKAAIGEEWLAGRTVFRFGSGVRSSMSERLSAFNGND